MASFNVISASNTIGGASGSSYLVYTALLTQSGTDAPVATVLQNTLGNIVWSWDNGLTQSIGTLAGAFPAGKVIIFIGADPTNGVWLIAGRNGNDNQIYLRAGFDFTTFVSEQGAFTDTPIEIRVYQ